MQLPKTAEALDNILEEVIPKIITTLISVKFWFCLVVLIGGLVQGGMEGFTAAVASIGIYGGTKAYQNVQFAKLNNNHSK